MTMWNRGYGGAVFARLLTVALIVWLLIGVLAAWQRHYFNSSGEGSCAKAGTIAVTVLAGPLNYLGANPKVSCHLPQPST
jgi:DNA-binding transcriptional regulator of glucitol operon